VAWSAMLDRDAGKRTALDPRHRFSIDWAASRTVRKMQEFSFAFLGLEIHVGSSVVRLSSSLNELTIASSDQGKFCARFQSGNRQDCRVEIAVQSFRTQEGMGD
jgi:hypothetical protein